MRAPPTIRGSIARSIGTRPRYREYLWGLGLGVAEAMDTAQRGMGLDWPTSLELIRRAVKAGKAWEKRDGRPALIASGCGTDHLDLDKVRSIDEVIRAYEEQMAAIERRRRPPDRDGEPGARAHRQVAGRLRARLRPRALARRRSR